MRKLEITAVGLAVALAVTVLLNLVQAPRWTLIVIGVLGGWVMHELLKSSR